MIKKQDKNFLFGFFLPSKFIWIMSTQDIKLFVVNWIGIKSFSILLLILSPFYFWSNCLLLTKKDMHLFFPSLLRYWLTFGKKIHRDVITTSLLLPTVCLKLGYFAARKLARYREIINICIVHVGWSSEGTSKIFQYYDNLNSFAKFTIIWQKNIIF